MLLLHYFIQINTNKYNLLKNSRGMIYLNYAAVAIAIGNPTRTVELLEELELLTRPFNCAHCGEGMHTLHGRPTILRCGKQGCRKHLNMTDGTLFKFHMPINKVFQILYHELCESVYTYIKNITGCSMFSVSSFIKKFNSYQLLYLHVH